MVDMLDMAGKADNNILHRVDRKVHLQAAHLQCRRLMERMEICNLEKYLQPNTLVQNGIRHTDMPHGLLFLK